MKKIVKKEQTMNIVCTNCNKGITLNVGLLEQLIKMWKVANK